MDLSPVASPVFKARDVTMKDFRAEVLEASLQQPVVVDFWAPWCQPCKQLGPILEKLVAATKGAVKMVKVDIDQNQAIAAQMGIQSIPAVFAFFQGQPVDGFMGNQPESTVKAWLDKLVKLAGVPPESPIAAALAEAQDFLDTGDLATAGEIYSQIIQHEPGNALAYAGLIRIALADNQPDEAAKLLANAPPEVQAAKEIQPLKAQLDLLKQAAGLGELDELEAAVAANPDAHGKRAELAVALHAAGRSAEAIDALIEIIRRDRKWNDEAARKQLLALFESLGHNHELTVAGRRKLSVLLFR